MKTRQTFHSLGHLTLCAWLILISPVGADLFGSGTNQFALDFVSIGHVGNTADSTGYGAVGYNYRIGQAEVTIDQFLKARAADVRIGDGDENFWNNGAMTVGPNAPASRLNWFDAAKFCNWLTTGDAHFGVYQFDGGGLLVSVDRSYRNGSGRAYMIPNENEWYKAAYFKSDASGYSLYAHGLNSPPPAGTNGWNYFVGFEEGNLPSAWQAATGTEEQNGTFDMNGNLEEWVESAADGILDDMDEMRITRGGMFSADAVELQSTIRFEAAPSGEVSNRGFRVVSIPEPSSALLLMVGAGGLLFARRRRRVKREQWMR